MYFPYTVEKRDEVVKSDYDGQQLGVERGSSEVVCQKDGSTSPAAEARITIHLGERGVPERVPSCAIKLEDGVLRGLA